MNGILCIYKPKGITSFDVVAKVRKIAGTKKVGHAGTLDPMATGVLPIFINRATKACDCLPIQDKSYQATFLLGKTTDTQDITGTVLTQSDVCVTQMQIQKVVDSFLGQQLQTPPMYSAIKIDGKKLYELARKGIEVERTPRPITIYDIQLLQVDLINHLCTIHVDCSKGTYIRTICEDIGNLLGCGATMTALERTVACGYTTAMCISLEEAAHLAQENRLDCAIKPMESVFSCLQRIILDENFTRLLKNGVKIKIDRLNLAYTPQDIAVYNHEDNFLGIATIDSQTLEIKMKKLFTID
ncbi:MAG: tRNA pseudouridine(55) synthase TruB [Oscillospiraceae bacterium]